MIAQARPSPLSHESATPPQLALLVTCFALISIGGGGIFCSLAFGADQLNNNYKGRGFLNKACIITNNDNNSSRSVYTIEQVEELKAIIKARNFKLTNPSRLFSFFIMISVFITAGVYDRLIIPLASKLRGKPVRISAKNRMGIGLFLCFLDLVVSAVVENIRRRKAIREGYIDNPEAVLDMSAMWLIPHNVLNGIAEAFNAIRQSEFYYTEFPRRMSSIAAALFS
ncbi:hypothetical protein HN51_014941 [Arachis hypogaea]